jgi:hypothetical protein
LRFRNGGTRLGVVPIDELSGIPGEWHARAVLGAGMRASVGWWARSGWKPDPLGKGGWKPPPLGVGGDWKVPPLVVICGSRQWPKRLVGANMPWSSK